MILKNKIKSKKTIIGSWLTIGNTSIPEIYSNVKLDFLVIDMEHSSIDYRKCKELIISCDGKNIPAIVRVGENNSLFIKKVMDFGAQGVIVPMVNNSNDASNAVNFVKYPPEGNRGVGLYRAQGYGQNFNKYKNWLKNNSIVIAQLETKEALQNLDEILNTKYLDGIMIGPYDLSGSLGVPGDFSNPIYIDAINEIETKCKQSDVALGCHVINPDYNEVNNKLDLGYKIVAFSIDFMFLNKIIESQFNSIKKTD